MDIQRAQAGEKAFLPSRSFWNREYIAGMVEEQSMVWRDAGRQKKGPRKKCKRPASGALWVLACDPAYRKGSV